MPERNFDTGKQLLADIAPVVPVADFSDTEHAAACCELFNQCSVPSVEVTLRRSNAWDSLSECVRAMPNAAVGVGTIVDAEQLHKAKDLGVAFAISPGLLPELVEVAQKLDLPYFPGIATASELMLARSLGLTALKFFPAEAAGGIPMLKGLGAPFAEISFCPTGGISQSNYRDYLALANVSCVGGSFVIPSMAAIESDRDAQLAMLVDIYG